MDHHVHPRILASPTHIVASGLSQDVQKLLLQIRDRPARNGQTVPAPKPLPVVPSALLISFAVNDLIECIRSAERPEDGFAAVILFLYRRLEDHMNVIGHHAGGEEFVTRAMKMTECVEDDRARGGCEFSPVLAVEMVRA